jgi:hypothetical protein
MAEVLNKHFITIVDNINENIEIAKNENENDNITENFFFIF